MVTNDVQMLVGPSGEAQAESSPCSVLKPLFDQWDDDFFNASPSRFDRLYIEGRCRRESQFTAEYYKEKTCTEWELKGIGQITPMAIRALQPNEIDTHLSWWGRVVTGERPLAYSKIDSLFAAELHALLAVGPVGAQWFADLNSDGCYYLVLYRTDYEYGKAMASQLIELLKKISQAEEKHQPGFRKAIFLLRYHHHQPFGKQELLSFHCSQYLTPEEHRKQKLYKAFQEWADKGVLRQHYFPLHKFAIEQNIPRSRFEAYAKSSGLSANGVEFMINYWKKLMFEPLPQGRYSLEQALEKWTNMPVDERRSRTLVGYARSRNINPQTFNSYASVATGLKTRGIKHLLRWRENGIHPEITHPALTHSAIVCWMNITQAQRECLTTLSYVVLTGGDIRYIQRYLCKEGVNQAGRSYLAKGHITSAMLHHWDALTNQQRQFIGLDDYAAQHRVGADYWRLFATLDGLTPGGKLEKQLPGPEALLQKVNATFRDQIALNTLLQQGTELGRKRRIFDSGPQLTGANISAEVSATIAPAFASVAGRAPLPAAPSIMAVKQEPEDNRVGEYCWEPRIRLSQQWRNAGPLLTSPLDPQSSLTATLLSARPLRFTFSAPLNEALAKLTPGEYQRFLDKAERFASETIKQDGKNQPQHFARLIAPPLLEFVADAADPQQQVPDPVGLKVVAACEVERLTIVGAYTGTYLANAAEQSIEYALIGAERSLGKSWTLPARADGSAGVVSAFRGGNLLSLVNTWQLPGLLPPGERGEEGWKGKKARKGKKASKGNNLGAMFVNELLPVYVAIAPIEEGEELLIDYEGLFNPLEIKQESYRIDTLSLIARRYKKPVIIENPEGEQESGWNSDGQSVERGNSASLAQPAIILRQRINGDGYIWYDAINAQGEIIAKSPEHPYDNFWHALATALFTEVTPDNITQLKCLFAEQADHLAQ